MQRHINHKMGIIKETIESGVESGSISKYEIARARCKNVAHSTVQYPSFLAKIEDVETCLNNLGYEIIIKGGGGKK